MLVEPISISGKEKTPAAPSPVSVEGGRANGPQEPEKPVREPELSRIDDIAGVLQEKLKAIHDVDLRFTVHGGSGKIMVTVIDESTGEVIREIPSSEILKLNARLDEMIGLLFDQRG